MTRTRRRHRSALSISALSIAAALAASLLTGLAGPTAQPAAAAEQDLVVPGVYGAFPTVMANAIGSSDVLVWRNDPEPGTRYRLADGRRGALAEQVFPGARAVAGPFALLGYGFTRFDMVDLRTGKRRTLSRGQSDGLQPLPDGGWTAMVRVPVGDEEEAARDLVRYDAQDREVQRLPLGRFFGPMVADERGAVLRLSSTLGGTSAVEYRYVDWATGVMTTVGRAAVGAHAPQLTAVDMGWLDAGGLVRVDRATLLPTSRRSLDPASVARFVLTTAAAAWTDGVTATISPEASPSTRTRIDLPVQGTYVPMLTAGDEVVVVGGATPEDRGLYAVEPSGATRLLVDAGPTAPRALALARGRVVLTDPRALTESSAEGDVVEHRVLRDLDGTPSLGPRRTVLRSVDELGVVTGGGLTAASRPEGADVDTAVTDGAGEVAAARQPGTVVAVSGHRTVSVSGAGDARATHVTDLRWLGGTVTLPGLGHLWGGQLARLLSDGQVLLRDLDTGTEQELRPADGAVAEQVLVDDGWVLWRVGGATTALRLSDGLRRELPATAPARLSGGRAAWADPVTREVHLVDLAEDTTQVVGRLTPVELHPYRTVALAPDAVAWTQDDGTTRLRPLEELAPRAAQVVSGWAPRRASPVGGLVVRLQADRATGPVRLTVTDPAGAVVADVEQTSPDGALRLSWDLRRPDGSAAPEGDYRWRVEGIGSDRVPLDGVVTVDRTVPDLVATIPLLDSDLGPGPGWRVSWRSSDPSARFDLIGSSRLPGPDLSGAYRFSSRDVRVVAAAPAGSRLYPSFPGGTDRWAVVVRDEAGNTRRSSGLRLSPYDDRATAFRFSRGWVRGTASNHWRGTWTETTTAGASMTWRGVTNRVVVVATRCGSCGQLRVSVDGRVLRTVDTRAASLLPRQRVVDLDLGGIPRTRTVTITAVGTAGHPRVRLDALALLR